MGRFLYIVYDWSDGEIKVASYNRDKVYAKVGEDYLAGDCTDNYHVIEIDLEHESLLREVKEVEETQ